ncbi:flagellar hook-associated protein FlgK [Pikeienuella sp. HZG-20]|uniref:flagellar hook-associated protein FlgK n=1 Tax=Paludibacillus litoralis TaxID=3133267 RepID=UPI0030EE8A43
MTLSLALSNAVSGIRATTLQTELISNNISNALTEGYGRREAALSVAAVGGVGGGVRTDAVVRASAPGVQAAFRISAAGAGDADARAAAMARIADAVGEPGEVGALATAADRLDSAIAAAADTPESGALLADVVFASNGYAAAINRIAAETMALRTEADSSIASQVRTLNDTLTKVQSLNAEIKGRSIGGGDISALEDQRDRLIRNVSGMIPIKVVPREFGTVALFAKNGAQLLDGKVFELGFEPTALVTPEKSLGNGALSGLTINGIPVPIGSGNGRGLLDGGSLSATFELRDNVIPEISATLDDLAADLITRTQGLAADPTLGPGDAGLFTDDGAAFDPADLVGVSLRLSINPEVDPAENGEVFRIRDGIGAATPGDVGASGVLRGLQDALGGLVAAPAGSGITGRRDAAGFAMEFSGSALSAASAADGEAAFLRGQNDELSDALVARTGVDSDQELARLLVVEQAFAANARVVQVVDDLLEILTRL